MKDKIKHSPVYDALDFPIENFVLSDFGDHKARKDGRKWKAIARDRKLLFVQIAKHGETGWPGINGLVRKTGFSRRKVFNLLDDLKELGCVVDALDEKGRKYSGEHGSRVRAVNLAALPVAATGVLDIKELGLLIRVVKTGVQDSESGVQNSLSGVHLTRAGVQNSLAGVHSKDAHEVTQKELPEVTPEITPPRKAELAAAVFQESASQGLGVGNKRAELEAALTDYTEKEITDAVKQFVTDGTWKGMFRPVIRMVEEIPVILSTNRKQRAEGEPTISPELEAQQLEEHKKRWNITLPELEQRLQETVASLEMFRGGMEPDAIAADERKIKSLTEDIEKEKAYLATVARKL